MPSIDDLHVETPRLILRPPRTEDLDQWSEMMADEVGGAIHRRCCTASALLAAIDDDDRCVARAGIRDVLRHRKRDRTMGRPGRTVAAGRLAGHRDRMGDRARSLGARLCRRRGGGGDELGVRDVRMVEHHPLDRARESRFAAGGAETRVTKSRPRENAATLRA